MQLSLARVSILRKDLSVVVDDYIRRIDKVYDYLTRYSGIVKGDLVPETSQHNVVSLKHNYLKLRYLLDRGCIFVGHGLKKDFRILNIFVPKNQVRDTVNLFRLPKSRMISLRFLADYLLNIDIQGGNHDSIEDASTAMKVYEKYLEMCKEGKFDNELQEMFVIRFFFFFFLNFFFFFPFFS